MDLGRVVLARHEVGDVIHRARAVEGVHSDEVLEALGVQLHQPFAHSAGFELEHGFGVPAGIEVEGGRVVDGDVFYVEIRRQGLGIAFLDEGQAAGDDTQGLEAEEVHLQHSHVLDLGAFVLAHPHLLAGGLVFAHGDGDVVREVAAADDHGAGVDAYLADAAFQALGVFQHLAHQRLALFIFFLELGNVFEAVLERGLLLHVHPVFLDHEGPVGDEFGEAVALVQVQVAHAGHVLYGELGGHGAEGDDMGDVVGAVEVLHVLYHAVAALIVEVHVDIRHGDSFRIQEALEEEVVLDRVQIGDAEAVGHHTAGGAASPGAHRDAVALGPVDEVLDYEEVVREAHVGDGLQLEVDAFAKGPVGVDRAPITLAGALPGEVAEECHGLAEFVPAVIAFFVVAAAVYHLFIELEVLVYLLQEGRVDGEFGKDVGAVDIVALHLLHHLAGVEDGLRVLREQGQHLVLALQIFLLGVAEALGVADHRVGGEADEAVVRRAVVPADKVRVVRGHHLDPVLFGKLEDGLVYLLLVVVEVQAEAGNLGLVEHHLQIVILAEDALVPLNRLVGSVHIPRHNAARNLAGDAGGRADEPFVVFLDHLVAHARLAVIHSLDVAGGDYLHQVLVALIVLGQQDEVVVFAVLAIFEVMVVMLGYVGLAAQDWLDVGVFLADVEELLHTIHVAVVRDCQTRHLELVRTGEELLYVGHPIEDGILGMDVKGYETSHLTSLPYRSRAAGR